MNYKCVTFPLSNRYLCAMMLYEHSQINIAKWKTSILKMYGGMYILRGVVFQHFFCCC